MANADNGKRMTCRQLIRKGAFVKGFNAARTGKPFDYDAFAGDIASQWAYERGRVLGLTFTGALKTGAKATLAAQWALHNAIADKTVV